MPDVDGKAIIEALAANVLGARFEDLDAATVENASWRIIDTIGCAIGGAREPSNAGLIDLLRDWGGKPEATVLGHGLRGLVPEVAMVNSILCRSFDWGPLTLIADGRRFPTHTSETRVVTALGVGESGGGDGRELITALVAGDDLAARLWIASERPQPGQGPSRGQGFEPWGTITTFGAAAIAGRLLGLDRVQLRHAIGIALNMISGAGSGLWDGATMFKLSQGSSARSGVNAAQLAKAGWTGLEDPLFGAHGSYYATLAGGCDHPQRITRDLGRKFHAEVIFKPYPGGRPTPPPIHPPPPSPPRPRHQRPTTPSPTRSATIRPPTRCSATATLWPAPWRAAGPATRTTPRRASATPASRSWSARWSWTASPGRRASSSR